MDGFIVNSELGSQKPEGTAFGTENFKARSRNKPCQAGVLHGVTLASRHANHMPESFQDRSFRFSVAILRFYRAVAASNDVPRQLADQMLRAGTAIGANLEEAKSAHSRRDLAAKYVVSLREARECHYWLRLIATDRPKLTELLHDLLEECSQLIAILTAAVKKLRSNE